MLQAMCLSHVVSTGAHDGEKMIQCLRVYSGWGFLFSLIRVYINLPKLFSVYIIDKTQRGLLALHEISQRNLIQGNDR